MIHVLRAHLPSGLAFALLFAAMLALGTVAGCKDDSGESMPVPTDEPVDPAGVWTFSITVTKATQDCAGEEGDSSSNPITITKTGSEPPYEITASGFLGISTNTLTGTFDDNVLTISGSYPEETGTTSPEHVLIATSNNEMRGTETWNWTDSIGNQCPGSTSDVVATRVP